MVAGMVAGVAMRVALDAEMAGALLAAQVVFFRVLSRRLQYTQICEYI